MPGVYTMKYSATVQFQTSNEMKWKICKDKVQEHRQAQKTRFIDKGNMNGKQKLLFN